MTKKKLPVEIKIDDDLPEDVINVNWLAGHVDHFLQKTDDFEVDRLYLRVDKRKDSVPKMVDGEEHEEDTVTTYGGHIWVPDIDKLTDEVRVMLGRSSIVTISVPEDSEISYPQTAATIWHELQHMRQYAKGDLSRIGEMLYWKNSPWYTLQDVAEDWETYYNAPWEVEAREWGDEGRWAHNVYLVKRNPIFWLTLIVPMFMFIEWMFRRPAK